MIRLPLLFHRPRNPLWYLVLWVPYIAIYQLSNRFPLLEPHQLPMTALDRAVPFLPRRCGDPFLRGGGGGDAPRRTAPPTL